VNPDLELVGITDGQSFKIWSHGYPYRTVRWHFHPEYEVHFVTNTNGRYFVGDFIGEFEPGNLVMTGPNLPHNWVSNIAPCQTVPYRSIVLQFTEAFIEATMHAMPELRFIQSALRKSRRGIQFSRDISEAAEPILREMLDAAGFGRVRLFLELIHLLCSANGKPLTSATYAPDPSGYMSAATNKVIAHIREKLTEPFTMGDLAKIAGQTPSAFSRSFRKHTGMAAIQYVSRLRINLACQLLMSAESMSVTDICYEIGFNNISNFNRQFRAQKGVAPSEFRALSAQNRTISTAAGLK